tara:strand:- start:120 stop:905 length:786 start_codon:yes stop_codon:yes gene_type:complete
MNYFKRQQELKDFDQNKIKDKRALVLGVGGIGTNVSIALVRLGFKKIYLVDYDDVEDHNLNRQQLYNKDHIGKSKVECAKETLLKDHNLVTNIEIYNIDALKEWSTVVGLIIDSDVVFNTIDYGDHFDYAVSSACLILGIPMILGGTDPFYGHLLSTFFQTSQKEDACYACCHDIKDVCIEKDEILGYEDISFLPKDSQPDKGGSTVYSAAICSHLIVSQYVTFLMKQDGYKVKNQLILRLINLEMDTFECKKEKNCQLCD